MAIGALAATLSGTVQAFGIAPKPAQLSLPDPSTLKVRSFPRITPLITLVLITSVPITHFQSWVQPLMRCPNPNTPYRTACKQRPLLSLLSSPRSKRVRHLHSIYLHAVERCVPHYRRLRPVCCMPTSQHVTGSWEAKACMLSCKSPPVGFGAATPVD
jgi:hypothetical protein